MQKLSLFFGLALISILFSSTASAVTTELEIQSNKIFVPDQLSLDSLRTYEKNFKFNWNNPLVTQQIKQKINEIENFIKSHPNLRKLSSADREAMGRLFYKIGTYYLHILQYPDLAAVRLSTAAHLLTNLENKMKAYNQLAYAYRLKFVRNERETDKEKALAYANQVINFYKNANNQQVAFAHTTKGLVEYDVEDYNQAEMDLRKAISIYENIPNGKTTQYARTKSRLANVLLNKNKNENELNDVLIMLEDLEAYWAAKPGLDNNIYAARNLITLGYAHLKIGNPKAAQTDFNKALNIYTRIYGYNNPELVEPYEDLADTYNQLGDDQQVEKYLGKADQMDRS